MTENPVCFSSRYGIGVTFLMWSYHWLLGHTHYRNGEQVLELPANPNTGINAHFFKKNYCAGLQDCIDFISNPANQTPSSSMYGGTLRTNDMEQVNQDYANALLYASENVPVIFCVESLEDPWYFLTNRSVTVDSNTQLTKNFLDDFQYLHLNSQIEQFFNDSLTKFDKSVWDIRELIALNFNYFVPDHSYIKLIDQSIPHLRIDSRDLWYNGESCVRRVFKYIGADIVENRVQHWKKVYTEWQSIQLKILQFNWHLPAVVEAVINDHNFDLDFLNLNLLQEAVIQGHLIQNHNMNLKTWGLTKFPSNTKDLHCLLEQNIHSNKLI
jgi:hypothetical protein